MLHPMEGIMLVLCSIFCEGWELLCIMVLRHLLGFFALTDAACAQPHVLLHAPLPLVVPSLWDAVKPPHRAHLSFLDLPGPADVHGQWGDPDPVPGKLRLQTTTCNPSPESGSAQIKNANLSSFHAHRLTKLIHWRWIYPPQVVLIISGNLSFLNWLTIVPSLACFDDVSLGFLFSSRGGAKKAVLEIQREDAAGKSPKPTRGSQLTQTNRLLKVLRMPPFIPLFITLKVFSLHFNWFFLFISPPYILVLLKALKSEYILPFHDFLFHHWDNSCTSF